jgi:cytochrome P450
VAASTKNQLFGPAMVAEPYPVYQQLRTTDPVHWDETLQAWVLTRYKDVVAGLNDLRLSSARTDFMQELAAKQELRPFFHFLSNRMIFCDPPKHTRLRGLVSKVFTPHAVEAMRPRIQQLVDGFIDKTLAQGKMDLIHDFAFPLPATIIAEVLGLPPADINRLKRWSDTFVVFFSNAPSTITAEQYQKALHAAQQMVEYFRPIVARLHEKPGNTLLGAMRLAEESGDRLSDEELFANANLLLVAGHETTTNLIGNGMLALLQHPDQFRKLQEDPKLITPAVEEFLRYGNPVQFTNRLAREDVTIGGKQIKKGQFVFLVLAAANRDPEQFTDPDGLDITRSPNHHVSFGQGHHFCVGAPLARLEAQIAFAALLSRLPKMKLTGAALEYGQSFNLHGLKSLPIVW